MTPKQAHDLEYVEAKMCPFVLLQSPDWSSMPRYPSADDTTPDHDTARLREIQARWALRITKKMLDECNVQGWRAVHDLIHAEIDAAKKRLEAEPDSIEG